MSRKPGVAVPTNESLHRKVVGPLHTPREPVTYPLQQPDHLMVTVTTYGAFDTPIEGWSEYAKLGRGT